MSERWDWDVCYACNGAGYFDGGDMRDDETCHTCSGRGGAQEAFGIDPTTTREGA